MPKLGKFAFWKGVIAEFVAMMFFVYVGVGTAVSNAVYSAGSGGHPLITALAFGLCIATLVYATAHTSGGHINPAVTLGLTIMGVCHPITMMVYWVAQFLGAMVGAILVRFQTPGAELSNYQDNNVFTYGTNGLAKKGEWKCVETAGNRAEVASGLAGAVGPSCKSWNYHPPTCDVSLATGMLDPNGCQGHADVTVFNAALFEIVGTALLMFVVCETAINTKCVATPAFSGTMTAGTAPSGANVAPLAIGFAVFLAHCVGIPLTGCGINPARSFGSWFVSESCPGMDPAAWEELNGRWCHEQWLWIFLFFPFVGAAIAALLCRFVFDSKQDVHALCDAPKDGAAIKPATVEVSGPPSNA